MTLRINVNVNQIGNRMRRGVSDMSYAQRRVFENRTGIAVNPSADRKREPVSATTADELEALYARGLRRMRR
ncbi:MAG: hypothetical protein M3022_04540 [Actinomycetota bacterium]|nr:hypothetical protein [Actinomycetota bacterium]